MCGYVYKLENKSEFNPLVDYIKKNFAIKSSNLKKKSANECYIIKIGKKRKIELENLSANQNAAVLNIVDENDAHENFCFLNSIYVNSIYYAYYNEHIKFNNACIYINAVYGLIEIIIKLNDSIFLICKKLTLISNPFYNTKKPNIKSKFSLYYLSRQYFVINQKNFQYMKKFFFHVKSDSTCYISSNQTNHLFS